jgi:hypothetical protein
MNGADCFYVRRTSLITGLLHRRFFQTIIPSEKLEIAKVPRGIREHFFGGYGTPHSTFVCFMVLFEDLSSPHRSSIKNSVRESYFSAFLTASFLPGD